MPIQVHHPGQGEGHVALLDTLVVEPVDIQMAEGNMDKEDMRGGMQGSED